MDSSLLWWVLCAPVPLRVVIFWILISTRLCVVNFERQPSRPVTGGPAHVQHTNTSVRGQSRYNTACQRERCDPISVGYTRDQLFATPPARLIPDLTSRLKELDIGFRLPHKRSRRGGRNLKRQERPVPVTAASFSSESQTDLAKHSLPSAANLKNLITIALQTKPTCSNDILKTPVL